MAQQGAMTPSEAAIETYRVLVSCSKKIYRMGISMNSTWNLWFETTFDKREGTLFFGSPSCPAHGLVSRSWGGMPEIIPAPYPLDLPYLPTVLRCFVLGVGKFPHPCWYFIMYYIAAKYV